MTAAVWLRTTLVAALAGSLGCATAQNYVDPAGPVMVGNHAAAHRATSDVRIVSFNIKFGEHVDLAANLLTRPGPLRDADVLVVQEVDDPGTRSLSEALGFNYVYVPSAIHPSTHRDFGVAILSPWPLDDARKVPLPHQHRFRKLQRAAASATVGTPIGPLRVYAIHLESPFGMWRRDRRDQARAILSDARDWNGRVVVAGDFNGRSGAEEIAGNGFVWLTRHVHDRAFLFDFDHILVRGLCEGREPSTGQARDDLGASDHRAIWAVAGPCGT